MSNIALVSTLLRPRRLDLVTGSMLVIGAGLTALSFSGLVYMLVTEGHAAFNTSSDVAWGLPIAYYLFFLLASSGLSVLASLDLVFGLKLFEPVTKRCIWLAICTLVAGFSVLALEIGHPFRMLWALPLGMQIRSPMWWMGVFYSLDLVLLFVKFYLLHTGDWHSRFSHWVGILSFIVVILASGTLGLVFGMMAMRPAWYSPVMPVYFMISGFLTAIAFAVMFIGLAPADEGDTPQVIEVRQVVLPRLYLVALLGVIAISAGTYITGLWSNLDGLDIYRRQLFSARVNIELWVGLIIPFLMVVGEKGRKSKQLLFWAALMTMIGMFFSRLNLLIVGQEVPLFRGHWITYAEYWPSFTEWMLVPFGAGLFVVLYAAGEWLLNLGDSPKSAG
jgi:molybdopterin-containing oxidoreductase family membrane subunit